jgi:hypothetical protein
VGCREREAQRDGRRLVKGLVLDEQGRKAEGEEGGEAEEEEAGEAEEAEPEGGGRKVNDANQVKIYADDALLGAENDEEAGEREKEDIDPIYKRRVPKPNKEKKKQRRATEDGKEEEGWEQGEEGEEGRREEEREEEWVRVY